MKRSIIFCDVSGTHFPEQDKDNKYGYCLTYMLSCFKHTKLKEFCAKSNRDFYVILQVPDLFVLKRESVIMT